VLGRVGGHCGRAGKGFWLGSQKGGDGTPRMQPSTTSPARSQT
jgi:hypothetical protein